MAKPDLKTLAGLCDKPGEPVVVEAEELSADEAAQLAAELTGRGIVTRIINGAAVAGKEGLLKAVATAFGFPGHFGHNWDALIDCWSDLSWLPAKGYVCVLLGADAMRAADREAHDTFLGVCGDVAERWRGHDASVVFKLVRVAGGAAAKPKRAKGAKRKR
jgi:hypothetical protein